MSKLSRPMQSPIKLLCFWGAIFMLAGVASSLASPPQNYQVHPRENLSTLLPNCDPSGGATCTDDVFQKVWFKLVADNGEITKIDMNQTGRNNVGGAETLIYTYVANTPYDGSKMRRLIFDCHGRFEDITDGESVLLDAPPNSVAGRVSAIACSRPFQR